MFDSIMFTLDMMGARATNGAMKKNPWLFFGFIGDEILPSYVGSIS